MIPRKAASLIELLVVIALLAILLQLLLPSIGAVRERSRTANCLNNLRQLGIASQALVASTGRFPPGKITAPGDLSQDYGWGWGPIAALLPHLEGAAGLADIQLSATDCADELLALHATGMPTPASAVQSYCCPSDPHAGSEVLSKVVFLKK
jgi:hypothetical protein